MGRLIIVRLSASQETCRQQRDIFPFSKPNARRVQRRYFMRNRIHAFSGTDVFFALKENKTGFSDRTNFSCNIQKPHCLASASLMPSALYMWLSGVQLFCLPFALLATMLAIFRWNNCPISNLEKTSSYSTGVRLVTHSNNYKLCSL